MKIVLPSVAQPRHSGRRGIALVITLIMLSVTLIMAVAFLSISTHERGSVSTSTDANHARLAADEALQHAQGQIIANLLATGNPYNFGLLVSTNYVNPYGFVETVANPTNVNYNYISDGSGRALSVADYVQNIANLQFYPRAPVCIPNNSPGGYDFRYYLDLNRNGLFDDTGPNITNWIRNGSSVVANGFISAIGDPQWIGVLEHPDSPHGPNNRFIARYCFIAVPAGNTLDINSIGNDAYAAFDARGSAQAQMLPGYNSFGRNEGVGSWEINPAAFLADLNTNEWDNPASPYNYAEPFGGYANSGLAFEDALSLLRYRYGGTVFNLTNLTQFGAYVSNPPFSGAFTNIDVFGAGPIIANGTLPYINYSYNYLGFPWSGSGNTNHYFSLSDLFNPADTESAVPVGTPGFTDRLLNAGTNTYGSASGQVPTYDRYTFYRMLSELGTDSTPEYGQINLNFVNVDANGNVVAGMETNFIPWNPLQFFTAAANRMLLTYTTNWFNNSAATIYIIPTNTSSQKVASAHYYFTNNFGLTNVSKLYNGPFGISNIPVAINGQFVYTPAVHRLLQLAANIYDATTTNVYPSVFRPNFYREPGTSNIFITGYQQVTNIIGGIKDPRLAQPVDIALLEGPVANYTNWVRQANGGLACTNGNVYGVPWIIGAKKGLPNFNEMNVQNTVQVSRFIQVNRQYTNNYNPSTYSTNEMLVMSITNSVGASVWNPYYYAYAGYRGVGPVQIYMQETMRVTLTNQQGYYATAIAPFYYYQPNVSPWPGSQWAIQGSGSNVASPSSFFYVNWTNTVLQPSVYAYANSQFATNGDFVPIGTANPTNYFAIPATTYNYGFPQVGYLTTNWLQAFILDGPNVVDYVQLSGPNRARNLTSEIQDPNYRAGGTTYMWSTNGYPTSGSGSGGAPPPPYGEVNQILLSRGTYPVSATPPGGTWSLNAIPGGPADVSPAAQQAFFGGFFSASWTYLGGKYVNTQYSVQAPYVPTRTMVDYTLWEANDPLVHYLSSDLSVTNGNTGLQKSDSIPPSFSFPDLSLDQAGNRFQPWGRVGEMATLTGVDLNTNNYAYKDPGIVGPDAWQFSTNLYPNSGWLGRVHRGTPWQTVFLKSTNVLSMSNVFESAGTAIGASGFPTWYAWTGNNPNYFDATNTSPVSDRLLFDIFTAAPSANATLGQLSINQPGLAAWSAVLSGVPLYTNYTTPTFTSPNAYIQPAGVNGANYNALNINGNATNYLGAIYDSIMQTRLNTNLFPAQAFTHLGDICAVPAFTDASPFLKAPFPNDAMFEAIPQQTMGLLRVGAPRYVIYCYGQALKPAQNGVMTGGPYPLMCTNYQIVAESATRAVVQVENPGSSTPSIVVKNLNPLPPDQ